MWGIGERFISKMGREYLCWELGLRVGVLSRCGCGVVG